MFVKLQGGLGNQFFQYGLGLMLKETKNFSINYEISFYFSDQGDTVRKLDLLQYPYIKKKVRFSRKSKFNKLIDRFLFRDKIFVEPTYSYCSLDDLSTRYSEVVGFWQSYRYLDKVKHLLKEQLSYTDTSFKCKEFIKIATDTNSVCLHVRRGDYVTKKEANSFHGTLSPQYYFSIINKYFCENNFTFLIFSDDIEWCKDEFKELKNTFFVETDSACEDLEVMKQCKSYIIANSTFSWWGAYLSSNNDAKVYYPKRWFTDSSINTDDLFPKNWIPHASEDKL